MNKTASWILSNSHKTTIAGFAVAVLNLVANGISVKQALFSASLLALSRMAGDFDLLKKPEVLEQIAQETKEQIKMEIQGKNP